MKKPPVQDKLFASAPLRGPRAKAARPALVPKLRFPEFRKAEEWTAEPMGEVYAFKANTSLSRDKLNYVGGSSRNILYEDIHTKFSTHFDIAIYFDEPPPSAVPTNFRRR